MSYFCYVPEDAVGNEHLTLCWLDERPMGWNSSWREVCLNQARAQLPFTATIYDVEYFGKTVYLVALPHEIHKMRFLVFENLHQGITPWVPHISKVEGPDARRAVGDTVRFTAAEFRP